MVDNSWGMVYWGSMVDKGGVVDRGMVQNGGMVDTVGNSVMGSMVGKPMVDTMMGSMVGKPMVDTMSKMVGSMVDSMVGSMVTMETSMVDGGNNRMGSSMTSMSSMSNSVNSKAIFVDRLMAMLGRGVVNSPMVKGLVMGMGMGMSGNMICSGESKK